HSPPTRRSSDLQDHAHVDEAGEALAPGLAPDLDAAGADAGVDRHRGRPVGAPGRRPVEGHTHPKPSTSGRDFWSKPIRRVSGWRTTPVASRTRRATSTIRASTSSARPPSSAWMKLACLVDTEAVPTRRPLAPAWSMRRPAESPSGLVKTDPALGPPGWLARRQATISEIVRAPSSGSPGASSRSAHTTRWWDASAERR